MADTTQGAAAPRVQVQPMTSVQDVIDVLTQGAALSYSDYQALVLGVVALLSCAAAALSTARS